ncbi:MAG: Nif3-like dinuclear metal center hexameric protein [Candidatus Lernaella stagnicola]|nr:Nif3-like dinuclear metal center hexameric protein [Candidatus Lernaella stagnicola]
MASKTAKRRVIRVRELLEVLESWFPASLAEQWDNSGLLCGSPADEVRRVGIALEASVEAVRKTAGRSGGLLITHHPVIFDPLRKIDTRHGSGAVLREAMRRDVALVACHTNADWAPEGVNDVLAERLGLRNVHAWQPSYPTKFKKLVVLVPQSHIEPVGEAIFRAGGGIIGTYAKCSFRHPGEGTYLPLPGADPYAGKVGALSAEPEIRLEVRVPAAAVDAVLDAMNLAHPYEEVAFDLYDTDRQSPFGGVARVGELARPQTLAAFARRAARKLGARTGRFVGDGSQEIRRVVVCGGDGSFLLKQIRPEPGLVLVTGDVKYHEALDARAAGLPIVDLGHYATERPFVDTLAVRLAKEFPALSVFACTPEGDPFTAV